MCKKTSEKLNDPVYGKIGDVQKPNTGKSTHTRRPETRTFSTSSGNKPNSSVRVCVLCSGNHTLFYCQQFKKLTPVERFKFVHDKSLCNNCFLPGHYSFRCLRPTTCTVPGCGLKHATLIHTQPRPPGNEYNQMPRPPGNESTQMAKTYPQRPATAVVPVVEAPTCGATGASGTNRVALPIVPVVVFPKKAQTPCIQTYALLDGGLTNTFCSKKLKTLLNMITDREAQLSLTTLSNDFQVRQAGVVSLRVCDMDHQNMLKLANIYVLETLPIHMDNLAR